MAKSLTQFSMWALARLITLACVLLAIPGGFVLVLFIAIWAMIILSIGAILYACRTPINRFLTGN